MPAFDDFTIYSRRRILSAIVVIVFLVFLGRLYQLQLIYQDEYGKKSEENSIRTISIEPVRGYMIDRSGRLAVDNRPCLRVMEKIGMQHEGVSRDCIFAQGRWWTEAKFAMLASDAAAACAADLISA